MIDLGCWPIQDRDDVDFEHALREIIVQRIFDICGRDHATHGIRDDAGA
jgi:hypothetical protein